MSNATFVHEVAARFAAGRNVVLHAPTGAGKSTLLPLQLLQQGPPSTRILLVQPRQVAARAVAARIADLYGCELGQEVGYQVRFDRKASAQTRLLVVTDGIALQLIQADPLMEQTTILLLDEFHERSTQLDLLLAFARESQLALREDLRIGVLSATLAVDAVQSFLDAELVQATGRSFPLEIEYLKASLPKPWSVRHWERSYAGLIVDAFEGGSGDLLAFLPGVGEILRVSEALEAPLRAAGGDVFHLYGSMSSAAQDAVLGLGQRRRVVLATNVAETSLTVPGIDTVVDFGWVRRARVHPGLQVNRVVMERVSQASADQRAGRAGRLRAGRVFRAWSESDHRRLDREEAPEVQRVDPAGLAMEVLRWQGRDVPRFGWFEAPDPTSLKASLALLERLEFTEEGVLTSLGRAASSLPLHPRLSRMVLASRGTGFQQEAVALAAMLSETDFPRGFDLGTPGAESDIEMSLSLVMRGKGGPAFRGVTRVIRALERALDRRCAQGDEAPSARHLVAALLLAFPDRLAQRREEGGAKALLSSGTGIVLDARSTVVRSPYFVVLELDPRPGNELIATAAVGLTEDQLPEGMIEHEDVYRFSSTDERVEARRQRRIGAIVLSERPLRASDALRVTEILAKEAMQDPERHYRDDAAAVQWLKRYAFAEKHAPEAFPPLDETFWSDVFLHACEGQRSFDSLKQQRFREHFQNVVGWDRARALDRLAPEKLEVPSGSLIHVDYTENGPVLAVRLQEMFGCADTPHLLDGRVPVTLHLLAPNYRPQQVTSDLSGFWERTYPEVRKELRARYPKHAWPENPREAPPQRGARRRRH